MKKFLKNAVGLSLVGASGTSFAGAWSWPWESSNTKKDDDRKVRGFRGCLIRCREDSFVPFSINIRDFVYMSERGNTYRVNISRKNTDDELSFKVIVSKKSSTGKFRNLAFWLLHGPDLDVKVGTYVEEWIRWKEQSDEVLKLSKEDSSEISEEDIVAIECGMNDCAKKMRASKDFGYWRTYVCEDGSRRFV